MTLAAGWAGVRLVTRPSPMAWAVLLGAAVLMLSTTLPPGMQSICALAVIIVLGVPHGALDGEVAQAVLRPRFGRAWFLVFSLPYLGLSALVLLAWHQLPGPTLLAFLAASVWHFGMEDAEGGSGLEVIVRGGLPIAMPTLVQPNATAAVFQTVAGASLPQLPEWLWVAAMAWLALATMWAGCAALRRQGWQLAVPGLLAAMFVALPPLTAFAIYFVGVHAPAHTAAVIRSPVRAPRVHDDRSAALLALPITGLTLLIGAALWPLYDGAVPDRLLELTIQGLAALTLPHMLLDAWLTRRERKELSFSKGMTPGRDGEPTFRLRPWLDDKASRIGHNMLSRQQQRTLARSANAVVGCTPSLRNGRHLSRNSFSRPRALWQKVHLMRLPWA